MSNYALIASDGTQTPVSVTAVRDLQPLRTNLRLEQPPGASIAFAVGRERPQVAALSVTVTVSAASLTAARQAMTSLYLTARDAVALQRTTGSWRRDLMGSGLSVESISPTPYHAGGTDWRVTLILRPSMARALRGRLRVTSTGAMRVTTTGRGRLAVRP